MFYLKRKKKEADLDYLERVYSKTIKKETGSFLYLPLASIYYHKGNIEKAIETLQKGLSVHSSYVTAKYYLAFLYRENGEIDEAAKIFKKIAFSSPDHYAAHKALVDYYVENNDEKHAITELEELTRLTPYDTSLINQINDLKQKLINKPAFESLTPKKKKGKQEETEKHVKVAEKLEEDLTDDIKEINKIAAEDTIDDRREDIIDNIIDDLSDDINENIREELTETPIIRIKEKTIEKVSEEPIYVAKEEPKEKVEKTLESPDKIVSSLESWLKNIDTMYEKV